MAVDNSVNINKMRQIADLMYERAGKMGDRFQHLFDDVRTLQQYWKGQAYVDFARRVNQFDDNFTRIAEYFCDTLPTEIYKKANVYAKAQNEFTKSPGTFEMWVYSNVPVKDQGDTLVFNEAKVQSIQDKIEERFSNVEKDLQHLSDLFDKIPWTGEAKTTSRKIFKSNVNETIDIMQKIKKSLSANIQAAINANRKAEEGNATSSDKADLSKATSVISDIHSATTSTDSKNYHWKSEQ